MARRLILYKWTEKMAARATRSRLKRIENLLIEIGGIWGDEDQCLVDLADDLRTEVQKLGTEMDEAIAMRAAERAERQAAE